MTNPHLPGIPPIPADFIYSSFAEATALTPGKGANTYNVDLKRDWCIGIVPAGGYLAGLIAQVAKQYSKLHYPDLQQTDLVTLHQEFISACVVGFGEVVVTELSKGRQYSTLRIQLYQYPGHDRTMTPTLRIEALVRQGSLKREAASGGLTLPTRLVEKFGKIFDRRSAVERRDPPLKLEARPVFGKVQMLTGPNTTEQGMDSTLGPSTREHWTTWRSEREEGFDIAGVCCLADTVPPLVEAYGITGNWFPTLSMSVDVKKGAPEGGWKWLFVRVEIHVLKDGRFDYDVGIFDEEGEVVALSKHAILVVPSERNYKRSSSTKI